MRDAYYIVSAIFILMGLAQLYLMYLLVKKDEE